MPNNSKNFETMHQWAPYPRELLDIIACATWPPDIRRAYLADMERDPAETHGGSAGGLTLVFNVIGPNPYKPGDTQSTAFYYPVPAATWNRGAWLLWVFECLEDTYRHELMEWFVVDGERPFAPLHGPGDNPYRLHVNSTSLQRRTSFRGEVKDEAE